MDTPPRQPLPDHIRSRPGMYVGGASAAGIRNIALFAIESLLDAPGACASHAVVTLLRDGWLSVEVAGAIPQVKAEDFTAECRDAAPPFMDLTIAAAMCDRLDVECICSGRRWSQSFSAGHPLAPPAFDETDAAPRLRLQLHPDPSLFKGKFPGFLPLCGRVQELAIFHPDTRFRVEDPITAGQIRDYQYPRGLMSYYEEVHHPFIDLTRSVGPWHLLLADGPDRVEAVIGHLFGGPDAIDSFVNGQRTAPSGSHVLGLASAVREVVARDRQRLCWMAPSDESPFGGLAVALSLRLAEPSWAGAIKWRLEGDRPRDLVYRMVTEQLPPLLAETGRARG